MKNINQSPESLMKISPLSDVYHEPKQTYTNKGGWFGFEDQLADGKSTKKLNNIKSNTKTLQG